MASFYVTLPSNSSPTVYPNNTLTNYRVKLPQPISLEGQWEVGLAEMIYPHQWYNIDKFIKYSYTVNGHQWWSKTIDPGFYEDTASLVAALATNYPGKIRYIYNGKTRRLRIELDENCQVRFRGRLAEILGFKTTTTVSESLTIDNPLDMKHIHNLYVYCDIVEPHAVGHSKVALLRVINVTGKFGDDGATALGKEALRTGVEIAGDVLDGRSVRQSARTRGIAAGKRVAKKTVSRVSGSLAVKKRKRSSSSVRNKQTKVAKRSRDIFD
ncbi:hypothetical protein BSL78_07949 [Apostichopus japonicus]|uniref:Uncharacterized protein n=1 Tax=Stichopus japonicus TaxID=307972 RepID=A0A2G8L4M6_STIJA|nr:hypothetical protein BSL78_07949 [Apostichopus japonicus]